MIHNARRVSPDAIKFIAFSEQELNNYEMTLQEKIEKLFAQTEFKAADYETFNEFKTELRTGKIRAAEKDESGVWRANAWVKRGILLGFKMGKMVNMSFSGESFQFLIKTHTRSDR